MDRRDAKLAVDLARQWGREGLMPPASVATIEARHAGEARDDPEAESFGSGVLYGLGGVLLGAAVFAFLVLLQDNGRLTYDQTQDLAPWLFLAWGALCSAGAFVLDLVARKPRLGDALHIAALLAVTASGFPRAEDLPLGFLAVAFAAGVLWYRRSRFLVPFLAIVAVNVAIMSILFGRLMRVSNEETALAVWVVYSCLQVPILVLASRQTKWPWPTFSLAAATLMLAAAFTLWHVDFGDDVVGGFQGDTEAYLAVLMGAGLAAGLVLREKGLVLAAALVVAIDAIVFAFDVGELVGGLVAILAVAGLLIWQAGSLRRYLRET
jgi:hypothetical protein